MGTKEAVPTQKKSYDEVSKQILDLVGCKENVSYFMRCVTRLRFYVKDKSLVQTDQFAKVDGVIGTQWVGDQLQLIIGRDVDNLYNSICNVGGIQPEAAIAENLDEALDEKKKFSLAAIGRSIFNFVSPTMVSILPLMVGAGMAKTIAAVLGPGLLNVISETSDLYIMLGFLFNTFFYFLPIFLGYSAARVLKINPMYGIFLGAMIIVPDFVAMVGVRETFTFYGIPAPVANYSQTFLPVMLGVWIASYVIRFLQARLPKVLEPIFVPTLTILIMAPIMFIVCAPLGAYIGNAIGSVFITMAGSNVVIRIIGSVLLGILLPYMVLGGMHMVVINFAIMTFLQNGFESFVLPAAIAYNWAVYGIGLGATLKLKKPENKSVATGFLISGLIGGITEPLLYGTVMKYKNTMKALLISCAIGGLISGIFQPAVHNLGLVSVFTLITPWPTGGLNNIIVGLLLSVATFAAGAVTSYFLNYGEN